MSCSRWRTCKYLGTCCMDTYFEKASVQQYTDNFFNMTAIKKHVKTLLVADIGEKSW